MILFIELLIFIVVTIFYFKKGKRYFLYVIMILLAAMILQSVKIVPQEHVAVTRISGFVAKQFLPPGIYLKTPITNVILFPVAKQEIFHKFAALSLDGFKIDVSLSVNYHIIVEQVVLLYREIGPDFEEQILKAEIEVSFRDIAAGYTYEDLMNLESNFLRSLLEKKLQQDLRLHKYLLIDHVSEIELVK